METGARHPRRRRSPVGLALNYPRAGASVVGHVPEGWVAVEATGEVGVGVPAFDRLADELRSFRAHARAGLRLDADPVAKGVVHARGGPFRGDCKVVEWIDESLTQGVVVGTGIGNREVAEHRCVLEIDPETGEVTVSARTALRPGGAYLLPGGRDRRNRAHRRLVEAVVRELAREGTRVA